MNGMPSSNMVFDQFASSPSVDRTLVLPAASLFSAFTILSVILFVRVFSHPGVFPF